MSTDYFANAVFGVELNDVESAKLTDMAAEELERDEGSSEPQWSDIGQAMNGLLDGGRVEILADLQAKYRAPADTHIIWTGDDDHRPGGCQIGPDRWVLGYGLWGGFDKTLHIFKPEFDDFREKSTWHTWVDVSC